MPDKTPVEERDRKGSMALVVWWTLMLTLGVFVLVAGYVSQQQQIEDRAWERKESFRRCVLDIYSPLSECER